MPIKCSAVCDACGVAQEIDDVSALPELWNKVLVYISVFDKDGEGERFKLEKYLCSDCTKNFYVDVSLIRKSKTK